MYFIVSRGSQAMGNLTSKLNLIKVVKNANKNQQQQKVTKELDMKNEEPKERRKREQEK